MTYYMENTDGSREPINEWKYMMLTKLDKWVHVLREEAITIIKEMNNNAK